MVKSDVVESVRGYLNRLQEEGMPISFGVVFGSHARGNPHEWSDIDLLVVSPSFDGERTYGDSAKLWHATIGTDTRIEPIACGERAWEVDDATIIYEIARREGEKVYPDKPLVAATEKR